MRAGWGRWLLAVAGLAVIAGAVWLATTQGPLAPRQVTVARVEERPLVLQAFGIGIVEARRSYALGPTAASRVLRVLVDQGDTVRAGEVVAELDPVDLVDRVVAAERTAERAAAAVEAAEAQVVEARSRAELAGRSARRYAELRDQGFVSQEAVDAKAHEAKAANASVAAATAQVDAAKRDLGRARAEGAGVAKLQAQTRLVSRVDGVVTARLVEPGSTVVAGQAVVQVVDPRSLWVRARIDQAQAGGVRPGQRADVVLRGQPGQAQRGEVARVDLVADPVTEERIVNVAFTVPPTNLAIGDLVEVTVQIGERAAGPTLPTAAVRRVDRQEGVWQVRDGRARFVPARFGVASLDGLIEVRDGLPVGAEVIVHSDQALLDGTRIRVVPAIGRSGP